MIAWLAITFAAFFTTTADDVTKDPAKRDLDKLQGTWVLVGHSEKGRVWGEEDAKKEKQSVTIKGDTLTLTRDNAKDEIRIRLDPTKKPAWIDLLCEDTEEHKVYVNHAIYSLEGGRLTICVSRKYSPNPPEQRPAKFNTILEDNKKLPGLVLTVYRRQKK
jgi:uncharacterized protein (TIGR03067 family)